ncbi:hypothetical protein, unknown function [Leishmania donovani]|uniref:Uncharacterized protein n=1 Tax=Leishmania donovani TaxID=5661 RepID=E9BB68_LEIDO|nr:hypothetical protein, unknown function [Leishmania donovani]TPP49691.1 hypothetical protein CGC21_18200 [Leishmania donovani]CBZ32493.1 hypothetical protein, unknown function [Leishmania donovani]
MRKPSLQQGTRKPSRSPAGPRGIPPVVRQAPLSSDLDTPPPPSRRLRSRSSLLETTPSPPSLPLTSEICINVVAAQPCLRSKPVLQRRTALSVCKTSAVALVAPQTSRVLSRSEARRRREHVPKGHPGSHSADAMALRRPKVRSSGCVVSSSRPAVITTDEPIASQSSLRISPDSSASEYAGVTIHHGPRRQLEAFDRSAVPTLVLSPVSEAVSASFSPHTPLFAREEGAPPMPRVAAADGTPMSGRATVTALFTLPQTLNMTHSSTLSSLREAAPTTVEAAPLVHLAPLLESRCTTSSGQQNEERTAGHPSASHHLTRPSAIDDSTTSFASLWSPPMPPIAVNRQSTPSVPSITGTPGYPTMMDTAFPPPAGSHVTWLPATNARDLSECAPTSYPESSPSELQPLNMPPLMEGDGSHHRHSCMAPASQGTESNNATPAQVKSCPLGTPPLSHNPVAENPCSTPPTASAHDVSDVVHITHTPEQYRLRSVLPSSGHAVKASIPLQRVSASSALTHGASVRPTLMREGATCGEGARVTLSGSDVCTPSCHSAHRARTLCASPSRTPRYVSNSSDRHRPLTPTMSAAGAGNSVASALTKLPAGTLSAELTRRAIKERRRRELYAWNEHLRLQNESSVQDAV